MKNDKKFNCSDPNSIDKGFNLSIIPNGSTDQEKTILFNTQKPSNPKLKYLNELIKVNLINIKFYAEAQAEAIGRLLDAVEQSQKYGENKKDERKKSKL